MWPFATAVPELIAEDVGRIHEYDYIVVGGMQHLIVLLSVRSSADVPQVAPLDAA